MRCVFKRDLIITCVGHIVVFQHKSLFIRECERHFIHILVILVGIGTETKAVIIIRQGSITILLGVAVQLDRTSVQMSGNTRSVYGHCIRHGDRSGCRKLFCGRIDHNGITGTPVPVSVVFRTGFVQYRGGKGGVCMCCILTPCRCIRISLCFLIWVIGPRRVVNPDSIANQNGLYVCSIFSTEVFQVSQRESNFTVIHGPAKVITQIIIAKFLSDFRIAGFENSIEGLIVCVIGNYTAVRCIGDRNRTIGGERRPILNLQCQLVINVIILFSIIVCRKAVVIVSDFLTTRVACRNTLAQRRGGLGLGVSVLCLVATDLVDKINLFTLGDSTHINIGVVPINGKGFDGGFSAIVIGQFDFKGLNMLGTVRKRDFSTTFCAFRGVVRDLNVDICIGGCEHCIVCTGKTQIFADFFVQFIGNTVVVARLGLFDSIGECVAVPFSRHRGGNTPFTCIEIVGAGLSQAVGGSLRERPIAFGHLAGIICTVGIVAALDFSMVFYRSLTFWYRGLVSKGVKLVSGRFIEGVRKLLLASCANGIERRTCVTGFALCGNGNITHDRGTIGLNGISQGRIIQVAAVRVVDGNSPVDVTIFGIVLRRFFNVLAMGSWGFVLVVLLHPCGVVKFAGTVCALVRDLDLVGQSVLLAGSKFGQVLDLKAAASVVNCQFIIFEFTIRSLQDKTVRNVFAAQAAGGVRIVQLIVDGDRIFPAILRGNSDSIFCIDLAILFLKAICLFGKAQGGFIVDSDDGVTRKFDFSAVTDRIGGHFGLEAKCTVKRLRYIKAVVKDKRDLTVFSYR